MLPRGGIVWPPARDECYERTAGQAELAYGGACNGVISRNVELHELERAQGVDLQRCGGNRRPGIDEPQPFRDPLERRPLHERRHGDDEEHRVEDRLGVLHVGGQDERRKHDRDGPTQPRPSEQQPLAGGERAQRCRQPDRGRAYHDHQQPGEREAGQRNLRQFLRKDEQAQHDEHRHLSEERKSFMKGHELAAVP